MQDSSLFCETFIALLDIARSMKGARRCDTPKAKIALVTDALESLVATRGKRMSAEVRQVAQSEEVTHQALLALGWFDALLYHYLVKLSHGPGAQHNDVMCTALGFLWTMACRYDCSDLLAFVQPQIHAACFDRVTRVYETLKLMFAEPGVQVLGDSLREQFDSALYDEAQNRIDQVPFRCTEHLLELAQAHTPALRAQAVEFIDMATFNAIAYDQYEESNVNKAQATRVVAALRKFVLGHSEVIGRVKDPSDMNARLFKLYQIYLPRKEWYQPGALLLMELTAAEEKALHGSDDEADDDDDDDDAPSAKRSTPVAPVKSPPRKRMC
jgi:hypothetical protein